MLKLFMLLVCKLLSARVEVNVMKSGFGTFVLRFAAIAVLFAPTAAAHAQGLGRTVCEKVWDPVLFKRLEVCNNVYYPPPSPQPPPPEPPVRHTAASESTVQYDPDAEARKAQLRATERRNQPSSSLCPPPYRMTASDGCQK